MKKLLLSLLCVGFAQNAFGTVDLQKITLKPVKMTFKEYVDGYSLDEGVFKFHCDIVLADKQESEIVVGQVAYLINQIKYNRSSDGKVFTQTFLVIWGIGVKEKYRRMGIASHVVKKLSKDVQEEVQIDCLRANSVSSKEAARFWDKLDLSPMDDSSIVDYCVNIH